MVRADGLVESGRSKISLSTGGEEDGRRKLGAS
jgi:hypothetical protein